MAQENVEIVRRAFEAATRRPEPDLDTLTELTHPDAEMTTDYGAMGGDSFIGVEGFRQALKELQKGGCAQELLELGFWCFSGAWILDVGAFCSGALRCSCYFLTASAFGPFCWA